MTDPTLSPTLTTTLTTALTFGVDAEGHLALLTALGWIPARIKADGSMSRVLISETHAATLRGEGRDVRAGLRGPVHDLGTTAPDGHALGEFALRARKAQAARRQEWQASCEARLEAYFARLEAGETLSAPDIRQMRELSRQAGEGARSPALHSDS